MFRLLISCPDRPGVVAATTGLLAEMGANILEADQHSDSELAMRLVFDGPSEMLEERLALLADEWQMSYKLRDTDKRQKIVLLGSRQDHCLVDILWRTRQGFLPAEVSHMIVSSDDHRRLAEYFSVPYSYISPDDMAVHEAKVLDLIEDDTDLVVLARYMRILSADFLTALPCPAINIHHSFLPAFPGANPYQQAFDRGVKVIGATAHFVTAELDEGPIIDQDVIRVSHRQEAQQLAEIGADLERTVLARAVLAQLEDRVVVRGRRTIVL